MSIEQYKLRFLPLFRQDLEEIVDYISVQLKNPAAANRLVDEVQGAIQKRSTCAESFEPFHSIRERRHPYYRIYVGNYTIFYVGIGDVMEIRRILYSRRNVEQQL